MNTCETCAKRDTCTRATGAMFGGCNAAYQPNLDALYARLDNLEGCEDNPVYAAEIQRIRRKIEEVSA